MLNPRPKACNRCGAEIQAVDTPDVEDPRLCPRCAAFGRSVRGGLNRPAVLIAAGVIVLVISLFADVAAFGRSEGLGWRQLLGAAIAGVLLLCGGILRIPTLMVIGLLAGGLAMLADLVKFGLSPGFGLHQVAGCVLGAMLIGVGCFAARTTPDPAR